VIAVRERRGRRVTAWAWLASFLAYTGFWWYHTAAYGLWYHGPEPAWLFTGLTASLAATLALTAWWWLRHRK
jgi:hypothetical protein